MGEFTHILGNLVPWIREYGGVSVFAILTLESLGMPLPGESLLVVAAILSDRGEISLPTLIFSAWAGAVTGDNIGYLIGRWLGHNLLLHFGSKIGLRPERLAKVEAIFARYGALTVAFARFFNILRQLNGVVAGSLKMDWRRFLVCNAFGGAIWVIVWTSVGFYLGKQGADIKMFVHKLGFVGAAVFAVALLLGLFLIFLNRQVARRTAEKTKER